MGAEQVGLFDKVPPRAPANLLRDPAIAAAVAKCCVKQLAPNDGISYQIHPSECRWCRYPLERKLEAVREFVHWAGFDNITNDNPDWPVLEPSVEAFMQLPREEQARLATLAAGYTPNEWGEPSESFINDTKGPSPAPSPAPSGPVGGRDGSGERRGRGIGGPEETPGVARRGLPDRETQAPGPESGDLPVQDRFHNPDGTGQPF